MYIAAYKRNGNIYAEQNLSLKEVTELLKFIENNEAYELIYIKAETV